MSRYSNGSQAGGLYSRSDGFFAQTKAFLEIKGAKLKKGTLNQFQIKKIRVHGTEWSTLVLVCRSREPLDWTNPAEYDRCGFWFGVVSRKDYEEALRLSPFKDRKEVSVTVTPGNGRASGGKSSRSWLGDKILWTRSEDIANQPDWLAKTFGSNAVVV